MVTAAVSCWVILLCNYKELSLQNTGQISDPIRHFEILQSPVFLVNSRSPLLLDALINTKSINGFSSPEVTKLFCRVPLMLLFPRCGMFYQLTCFGFSTVYKLSRQNSKSIVIF